MYLPILLVFYFSLWFMEMFENSKLNFYAKNHIFKTSLFFPIFWLIFEYTIVIECLRQNMS